MPLALQDQLRELFLLDKQVRGMRSRLDAAIRRTQAQQNKREQLQRQHDELAAQLKQVQVKAATLEHQASEMDGRISKAREQMNSVKSNKEYSALLVEVNTLKVDKSKVEDQALEQMNEVDTLKQRVTEMEEKIQEQSQLESMSQSEVQSARDEVGSKLDELTRERDAAAEKLPPEVRNMFNRLADAYEGEALAEIEEQDRRRMEYTCGGCYLSLPVERVNAVMTRRDEVVTCPACNRILYINQDLQAAIGSK